VSRPVVSRLVVALLAASALAGCQRGERGERASGSAQPPAAAQALPRADAALAVPHASGPIAVDGEVDEDDWKVAGRTGPFSDAHGADARPFSDARFLWDEQNLYVTLYAADDDLRARVTAHDGPVWIDDAFSLHLTPAAPGSPTYLFDISPAGVTMDARRGLDGKQDVSWESGLRVAVDRDGTLNDPSDEDEEWVIEAAIPLRALGVTPAAGARLLVDISRCDTPRGTTARRCAAFGSARDRRALELAPRR
jgi:hypothetical protein